MAQASGMVRMRVGDQDGLGTEGRQPTEPVLAAVDHDSGAPRGDQRRTVAPMTPGGGFDVSPGAQESQLHGLNPFTAASRSLQPPGCRVSRGREGRPPPSARLHLNSRSLEDDMKLTKALPKSVATVRDEFDRLFDQMWNAGFLGPGPRILEAMWSPSVDFSENEKEYIVRLEAPGIPKEDLEVNLEGQSLTLSGRRDFAKEEKTEEYFWREREQGRFVRTIALPTPVDQSKVAATYQEGIMTIRLPKTEPTTKTRISIK
jgi:HSP20 family protein